MLNESASFGGMNVAPAVENCFSMVSYFQAMFHIAVKITTVPGPVLQPYFNELGS